MIHSNVGFKDVVLEALPNGHFKLTDPTGSQPACAIEFNNRKAARNWAHGRGMRVVERTSSANTVFPKPLG